MIEKDVEISYPKITKKARHKKYISSLGKNPKRASVDKCREVFISASKDFFDEKIPIYDLSALAGDIYYIFKKPEFFDDRDEKLSRLLHLISDADYYYDTGQRFTHLLIIYKEWIDELKEYIGICDGDMVKKDVEISYPKITKKARYKKYISSLGKNPKRASVDKCREVFISASKDFFDEKIPIHDLSALAGDICYTFRKIDFLDDWDEKLSRLLFLISDASYYYITGQRFPQILTLYYKDWVDELKEYVEDYEKESNH